MMEFLGDFTPAFHVPKWPEFAADWLHRQRLWPCNEVVTEIASKGCHVVPIGNEVGDSANRLDWRLSFSQAEGILADNLPQNARKVYLIAKAIFKENLAGICSFSVCVHASLCT